MSATEEQIAAVLAARTQTSSSFHTLNDVFDVLVEIRNLLSGAESATRHGPKNDARPPITGGRLNDRGLPGAFLARSHFGAPSAPSTPRGTLAEAIDQYLAQKTHEVSPQHLDIMRLTLRGFQRWIANWPGIELANVDKHMVTSYREMLLNDGRSIQTINNHMAILSAWFNWGIASGHCSDNPAAGCKLKNRRKASRARKAFTASLIEDVFDGLVGPLNIRVPSMNSAKRWLPLIMLYTGARPEEVAQLKVGDVKEICTGTGGLGDTYKWVFDFSTVDDGQRRKNEASRRLVPVHPRLWELGLHHLTNNPEGHLFPELTPGANGRLAEAPSRWFNQTWLRQVKSISDRKLVLYSLRHSVATHLKHKGVEESAIAQLLGHSNSSMTTGRYGKEYPVEILAEVVSELDWKV